MQIMSFIDEHRRTRQEAIAELTRVSGNKPETCFLRGTILQTKESTVRVFIEKAGSGIEQEFIKSVIRSDSTSTDTVLIELPEPVVKVLGLQAFVLDAREVEQKQQHAEMHNAPLLPQLSRKKVERLGKIKI